MQDPFALPLNVDPVHAAFVLNRDKAPESTGLGAQILHASTCSTLAEENGRVLDFHYRSLPLVTRVNVLKDSVEFKMSGNAGSAEPACIAAL